MKPSVAESGVCCRGFGGSVRYVCWDTSPHIAAHCTHHRSRCCSGVRTQLNLSSSCWGALPHAAVQRTQTWLKLLLWVALQCVAGTVRMTQGMRRLTPRRLHRKEKPTLTQKHQRYTVLHKRYTVHAHTSKLDVAVQHVLVPVVCNMT